MGLYLNPSKDKMAWLLENGKPFDLDAQSFTDPKTDSVTVCLVDNGGFMAAAVADTQREFDAFNRDDGRPKMWFTVELAKIAEFDPQLVTDIRGVATGASEPGPAEIESVDDAVGAGEVAEDSALETSDENSDNLSADA